MTFSELYDFFFGHRAPLARDTATRVQPAVSAAFGCLVSDWDPGDQFQDIAVNGGIVFG